MSDWRRTSTGKPSKKFISDVKRISKFVEQRDIKNYAGRAGFKKDHIYLNNLFHQQRLKYIKDWSNETFNIFMRNISGTRPFQEVNAILTKGQTKFIELPVKRKTLKEIKKESKELDKLMEKTVKPNKKKIVKKTKTVKKTKNNKKVEIKKLEKKLEELDNELEDAYQKSNLDIIDDIEKDIEKTADKLEKFGVR